MNGDTGQGFASVSRDRCTIFLCENDQGQPGVGRGFGVQDAGALADEFRVRVAGRFGIRLLIIIGRMRCRWRIWMGMFCGLGRSSRKGEAFGEFMDMDGRLWAT